MQSAPLSVRRPGSPGPAPTRYTVPLRALLGGMVRSQNRVTLPVRVIALGIVRIEVEAAALLAEKGGADDRFRHNRQILDFAYVRIGPAFRFDSEGVQPDRIHFLQGLSKIAVIPDDSDLIVHKDLQAEL